MKRVTELQNSLQLNESLAGFNIYFIGIGGIGMSAIARFFLWKGAIVQGYDRGSSFLTKELESEGATIHYSDDVALLNEDADIIIYTPAVPADMSELVYYRTQGYSVLKRSEILQWITEGSFNICIAGTHGKSTTTTLIAHILRDSGHGCNAFLGAISVNYNTNFWGNESKHISVVEADEFDRSFLRLSPNVAVITAMDADHLDIYGTVDAVQDAFVQFSQRIRPDGCLINKTGLAKQNDLTADHHYTYNLADVTADYHAVNIRVEEGSYVFDIVYPDGILKDIVFHLGGYHNIENAVAAVAVAHFVKIEDAQIKKALASFKGVKRRFEYVLRNDRHVLIDDYAHHPAELHALLHGVKTLYKEPITVVFQPHLYSRTRDLADGFAKSLDMGDEVIILPIYPARELPMPGVNSELILGKMKINNKKVLSKEDMVEYIKKAQPKVVVMCGAGDIELLVPKVKDILK